MGREVGRGIGMGKTCEPKAFSFQCMTEFTTKKKKIQTQPHTLKAIPLRSLSFVFHIFKQYASAATSILTFSIVFLIQELTAYHFSVPPAYLSILIIPNFIFS